MRETGRKGEKENGNGDRKNGAPKRLNTLKP